MQYMTNELRIALLHAVTGEAWPTELVMEKIDAIMIWRPLQPIVDDTHHMLDGDGQRIPQEDADALWEDDTQHHPLKDAEFFGLTHLTHPRFHVHCSVCADRDGASTIPASDHVEMSIIAVAHRAAHRDDPSAVVITGYEVG